MKKEVNSNIYDTNYFLSNNEGYREYENGLENNIHPKFARALEITNPKSGEVALDIGCGRGELLYYCAKKGVRVLGIDYSKTAIEIAKETIRRLPKDLQCLVQVEIGDVVKYNFREKYDIIFMLDIAEHMYDWQLIEIFKKVKGILKDEGRLIITTPNQYYEHCLSPIKRIINIPSNLFKWPLRILRGKYRPKSTTELLGKIFKVRANGRKLINIMHVNVLSPAKLKKFLYEFDAQIQCEDHSRNPISLITKNWWGREIIAVARTKKRQKL